MWICFILTEQNFQAKFTEKWLVMLTTCSKYICSITETILLNVSFLLLRENSSLLQNVFQSQLFRGIGRESVSSAVSSKLVEESVKLVYGKNSDIIKEGRFAGIQALSGTGACRLFAEFQRRFYPGSQIYMTGPTWSK